MGRGTILKSMAPPDGTGEKSSTFASAVYSRVRGEIILATLHPGQKLKVAELASTYGTGLAPIREALNRLSAEGLVVQTDQRGFSVAPISEKELDDLLKARCWLNGLAVRESIAHGESEWEEGVLLAGHRLLKTPRHISSADRQRNPDWEKAHRVFHHALLSACGSNWLIGFCDQLFTESERYRHIARSANVSRSAASADDEHRGIMEVTLARRADDAASLLSAHYTRTAFLVRSALGRKKIDI